MLNRLVPPEKLREVPWPLVLGCSVNGTAKIRGATTTGSGTIKYKITKHEVNDLQLRITDERVWVKKDVETGLDIIDPNIRNVVQNAFPSQVEYDGLQHLRVPAKQNNIFQSS